MKKVLVMTTINPPRDIFIKMLDQLSPDYSAVVVGDIQTPNCWKRFTECPAHFHSK